MKTLRKRIVQSATGRAALAAVLMAAVPIQQSVATPEHYSLAGIACQPANLGQAQNLGAKWSETNFNNPNPIGSGDSFFAVCPVLFGERPFNPGEQKTGAHDVLVFVERPAGAQDVTCSVRRFDQFADRDLVKTVSNSASSAVDTTGEGVPIVLAGIVDAGNQPNGQLDYFVVLCALPPGTGVNSVHFDYDVI